MNFGDKLTLLRKRNGLSQEELGEKLNVTRQTVSKWELGQSKPDTDKLLEISKLLNVDFNVLIDDTLSLDSVNNNNISNSNSNNTNSNVVIDDDVRPRKWLLVLLIIIALGIIIFLLNGYVTNKKAKEEAIKDEFSNIIDFVTGNKDTDNDKNDNGNSKEEEILNQMEVKTFNSSYEMYAGTESGSSVSWLMDNVITNNKTNKKHIIRVVFGSVDTTDEAEIRNLKKSLDKWTNYEVILDYDDNGFVNKITIEN